MLRMFESQWVVVRLFLTIRAVLFGLPQDPQNFFGVIELYHPDTRTFFTPIGELGISYHEMRYISGLDYGEFVYEERVPLSSNLEDLSVCYGKEFTNVYWEVLCHFQICADIHHC